MITVPAGVRIYLACCVLVYPTFNFLSRSRISLRNVAERMQRSPRIVAKEFVPIPRQKYKARDVPYVAKRLHGSRGDVDESHASRGRQTSCKCSEHQPPRMRRRHLPKDGEHNDQEQEHHAQKDE